MELQRYLETFMIRLVKMVKFPLSTIQERSLESSDVYSDREQSRNRQGFLLTFRVKKSLF